jgi:hypothetical protein
MQIEDERGVERGLLRDVNEVLSDECISCESAYAGFAAGAVDVAAARAEVAATKHSTRKMCLEIEKRRFAVSWRRQAAFLEFSRQLAVDAPQVGVVGCTQYPELDSAAGGARPQECRRAMAQGEGCPGDAELRIYRAKEIQGVEPRINHLQARAGMNPDSQLSARHLAIVPT